jgi:hypothetical protein
VGCKEWLQNTWVHRLQHTGYNRVQPKYLSCQIQAALSMLGTDDCMMCDHCMQPAVIDMADHVEDSNCEITSDPETGAITMSTKSQVSCRGLPVY